MKVKVSKLGHLYVLRGDEYKLQHCPFSHTVPEPGIVEAYPCGDWCPLFMIFKGSKQSTLSLCHEEYLVDIEEEEEGEKHEQ